MGRLARNLDDLRSLVQTLTRKGVCVEFVKGSLVFTGEDSPVANERFAAPETELGGRPCPRTHLVTPFSAIGQPLLHHAPHSDNFHTGEAQRRAVLYRDLDVRPVPRWDRLQPGFRAMHLHR